MALLDDTVGNIARRTMNGLAPKEPQPTAEDLRVAYRAFHPSEPLNLGGLAPYQPHGAMDMQQVQDQAQIQAINRPGTAYAGVQPAPYEPPTLREAAGRVGGAFNQTFDAASTLTGKGLGSAAAYGSRGLSQVEKVPLLRPSGGIGTNTPEAQAERSRGFGNFVGQQAPILAIYAAAPQVGIPTEVLDAYFAARGVTSAKDTIDAYNRGEIDGKQALVQLLPDIVNFAPVAIHAASLAPEIKAALESPEAQAIKTRLASEAGGGAPLNPGGEPVKPGAQVVEAGAGENGLPAAGSNLPSLPEPPAIDEAALATTEYIRRAEKLRPEQEQMFAEQRRQQLATAESRFRQSGENANVEARAATKGGYERPEFAPLELSPEHTAAIEHEINTTDKLSHAGERFQAYDAYDALKAGRLPQPAQLAALGKVLGPEFEQAVLDRAPSSWWNTALEVMGTSRALQATLDLSAALRQGIVGAVGHPQRFSQAFVAQLHALFSGDHALVVKEAIESHPDYHLVEHRVDLTALPGETSKLTHREEQFQSQLAERIPIIGRLIKASDRAFSTFTNKFRHDLAYDAIARFRAKNGEPTEKWLDNLGHYVNNLTGRGSTKALGEFAPTVNALFFSPKFLASRAQLIGDLLRKDQSPEIRAMAAKDIGSFVATGVGVLAAMKLAGVDVVTNPLATDFGKYKIGSQHHDFWAGYGPIARAIAQAGALGKKANPSAVHGYVTSDKDFAGILSGFLRSKLSPTASLAVDYSQGTQGGKDVNLHSFINLDKDNPLLTRITPLFFQDAVQMYQHDGALGLTGAPLAGLGESVTAYEPSEGSLAKQDKIAVQQKLSDTGFQPLLDQRKQASDARKAYVVKYGGTKEKDVAAANYYDANPQVKLYMRKLNNDELAFWSKTENKALLREAWDAGIDVQLSDAQVKKLLGIP